MKREKMPHPIKGATDHPINHIHVHKETKFKIHNSVVFVDRPLPTHNRIKAVPLQPFVRSLPHLYAEEERTIKALGNVHMSIEQLNAMVEYLNIVRDKIAEVLEKGEEHFFEPHIQDRTDKYKSQLRKKDYEPMGPFRQEHVQQEPIPHSASAPTLFFKKDEAYKYFKLAPHEQPAPCKTEPLQEIPSWDEIHENPLQPLFAGIPSNKK